MAIGRGVKSTMYRLGHRSTKHYILYAALLLAVGTVIAAGFLAHAIFQADTVITQAPVVTHHIAAEDEQVQHITKSTFALDLPDSWVAATPPAVPDTVYSWQGKAGSKDASRRLDVYIDRLPSNMAVNRLLPVQADQDHLDIIGTVSDNCVSFTTKTSTSVQTGYAASKWGGVNFLCDTGNYERNVVATGSSEGINVVTPSSEASGAHRVMLVYTDSSASLDYSVFLAIVKSFHLI